jgi:predicted regulator of Ras-like GTPase activity (Roadblock/LC7/MglB family)
MPVTPAPVQKAAPAPAPQPAKPAAPVEELAISLTALADAWPEGVRKEIVDLKLVDAKVALPVPALEQALKLGRIVFSWKVVRSWIRPAVLATSSPNDAVVLELPLKVVAPLFLARQKNLAKPHQKVAIDEDIPNLFFGFPQPEPEVPVAQATARPSDTNFYVWGDSDDRAKVDESEAKRPGPGTKFVAKYATPNEVVSRASALDGVAGVLIALPDGLLVANRLPGDVNADTLAAFLPHIFGKVSQCTKELRMGDLNNLNFTVGNVPWKIFRVNAIFFAAFGHPGEPLPTAQLAALAAELDHKPR